MKLVALFIACILAVPSALAAEGVVVPWEEFKALYRESVEREVRQKLAPPRREPQVYSIDEAHYTLEVAATEARGTAMLSGRVLGGRPEPIPLFGAEAVIAGIDSVSGGTVVSGKGDRAACFLPDDAGGPFQVVARLLVPVEEDGGARTVSFGIPHAVQNALELALPPESRLVQAPGLTDAAGVHRFSAMPRLAVRFLDKERLAAETVIEIDALSRIAVQKGRVFIATHYAPVRPAPDALILEAPEGAKLVSTSLRASAIAKIEAGRYQVAPGANRLDPFTIELALDIPAEATEVAVTLPAIVDNSGRQGRFVVEDPDDGEIAVSAEGLAPRIPVARLEEKLAAAAGGARYYLSVPPGTPITLTPKRFGAVDTPTTVLDCQYFFSSFEENGNVLSMLIMDVPGEVGARLELEAVPGAQIWALTVNGERKKVYAGEGGSWLVPLDAGQVSHVELAYLREAAKLGLQGRLEALLPETGLPAQEVRVGVALPARVELLSIEGPVSAAAEEGWEKPAEFVGKQYFFARSFYKGQGMELAVSYKEPVDPAR
ncbi:MAG: hypothetical protein JXR94_07210 [Candidatus Hydrogenedentes bacterium]|nr:hypothetical protein [Candidatus Hydrogenedentota bacterium]